MLNPLFRGGRIASCVLFAPRSVRAGRSMIATVYEGRESQFEAGDLLNDSCFKDISVPSKRCCSAIAFLTRNPTRNSDWFVKLTSRSPRTCARITPVASHGSRRGVFLIRLPDLLMVLRQVTSSIKPLAVIRQTRLSGLFSLGSCVFLLEIRPCSVPGRILVTIVPDSHMGSRA